MNDHEKIAQLREMIELGSSLIGRLKHYVEIQDEATIRRSDILREINGYEIYLNEHFIPEVIQ